MSLHEHCLAAFLCIKALRLWPISFRCAWLCFTYCVGFGAEAVLCLKCMYGPWDLGFSCWQLVRSQVKSCYSFVKSVLEDVERVISCSTGVRYDCRKMLLLQVKYICWVLRGSDSLSSSHGCVGPHPPILLFCYPLAYEQLISIAEINSWLALWNRG